MFHSKRTFIHLKNNLKCQQLKNIFIERINIYILYVYRLSSLGQIKKGDPKINFKCKWGTNS